MKKILFLFSIILLASCSTVKDYAIRLDDYYIVREQRTTIGYLYYTTVVPDINGDVTYKVNVNGKWYDVTKDFINKYRVGDNMKQQDYKSLKF